MVKWQRQGPEMTAPARPLLRPPVAAGDGRGARGAGRRRRDLSARFGSSTKAGHDAGADRETQILDRRLNPRSAWSVGGFRSCEQLLVGGALEGLLDALRRRLRVLLAAAPPPGALAEQVHHGGQEHHADEDAVDE